jgi:hypothetical protein
MVESIIFGYGVFVTLLLVAGLLYTVREFREIGRHPENYKPRHYKLREMQEEESQRAEYSVQR